jgi:uncharacterized protein YndB with AHSA1/START domain
MFDILHRVGIKTTPHKVFGVLTEEKGLAGWWAKSVTASPVVGAVNKFRFGDRGFNDMKVMELVPGKRVRWQCVDGAPEWIGTELTFYLKHEADSTIVMFRQRGWKEQVEFMHYCSTKWATYLLSLKSLCETGKGTSYPDDVDIG